MNLNVRYALRVWATMFAVMVAAWMAIAPIAYGGETDLPEVSAAVQETDQGAEGPAIEKPSSSSATDEAPASLEGASGAASQDTDSSAAPAEADIAPAQDAEPSATSAVDTGEVSPGADSPSEPLAAPESIESQVASQNETESRTAGASDDVASGLSSPAAAGAPDNATSVSGSATPDMPAAAAQLAAPVAKPAAAKQATAKKARTGKGNLAAGVYFIVSKLSKSKVVSIAKKLKKNGSNAMLWSIIGDGNQQWRVIIGKDGYATLKNVRTGKVLTVADKSKVKGTSVVQWKAKKKLGKAQKWIIKKKGAYYYIASALNKKMVLNVDKSKKKDGTLLNIWSKSKAKRQLFQFVAVNSGKRATPGEQSVEDGYYSIHALAASKRALDVSGHNTAEGAALKLQGIGEAAGQTFGIAYDGEGYYRLTNVRSGKKLAVAAAASIPGIKVGQYKLGANDDRAKWKIVKAGNGYQLVNKANSLAISVSGKGAAAKTNTVRASGANTQQFSLQEEKPLSAGTFALEVVASKDLSLSVPGSKTGKGVKLGTSKYLAGMNQRFLVSEQGGGYTIRSYNSRLYLTASGKTLVQDAAHANYANQIWTVQEHNGCMMLVNAESGLALTVSGSAAKASASLTLAQPSKAATQVLYARPQNVVEDGIYYIHMSNSASCVVGVKGNKRTSGANAQMAKKTKNNIQKFIVSRLENGNYAIVNAASGRALEVANGSAANGANVRMFKATGARHQQWKLALNGDFSLSITNAKTGTRLDVAGGKAQAGANVRASKAASGAGQEFWLTEAAKRVETVKIGVPCYKQNPQLPTGCESVALTNALRYWGFKLGKTTIADKWMPYGSNGVYNFIGNPRNSSGWIICAPGIAKTANKYLKKKGSKVRAKNVTGTSLKKLRKYLDAGCPVVVWTTIGMGSPGGVQAVRSGYPLRYNNHAVVLTGYNPKNGKYQVADSLAGVKWRSGKAFNRLYKAMGKQAVVLMD